MSSGSVCWTDRFAPVREEPCGRLLDERHRHESRKGDLVRVAIGRNPDVDLVLGDIEARRSGLAVTEAKVIAEFYDPADELHWVHEALAERYPAVDFSAVYE